MFTSKILCILIGYVVGLFQTGYIYGKIHNVDIRQHGSGNAGTTNTLRTLGVKAGAITFAGDCGKAIVAILIAWLIFHNQYPDTMKLLELYTGLGAVLGHNYPFYMKFKGGKGIACTMGVMLAFYWPMALIGVIVFILTVFISRYVSLGSILAVITLFIEFVVFGQLGILPVKSGQVTEVYVLALVFSGMALWRHRANIKRLLSKTENKLSFKKAGKQD